MSNFERDALRTLTDHSKGIGTRAVTIADNGDGITRDDIEQRFGVVGVTPKVTPSAPIHSFSRFGVGRLAVYRIGSKSRWTTFAHTADHIIKSTFDLTDVDDNGEWDVVEEEVGKKRPTGTTIQIFNIHDKAGGAPTPTRVANGLLSQFCAYLLAHPQMNIRVQGEPIIVDKFIDTRSQELLPADVSSPSATLNHILLKRDVESSRFPAQLLFSASTGRTVKAEDLDQAPSARYLCIVQSAYLDTITSSNKEELIEMDGQFARLRQRALDAIRAFGKRIRETSAEAFIASAREESYYPYKVDTSNPVAQLQQAQFESVLAALNERLDLQGATHKYREVIFKLLNRSILNSNVLDVMREVIILSDADMKKFSDVIQRIGIDSVVQLASAVTARMDFLDVLHNIVYKDGAHVQERTQLHKIVENHGWLFGPQYSMATSDKSFREVLKRHRSATGLAPLRDDDIEAIEGITAIPDLFLVSSSMVSDQPQHRHLIVEIKAPSVAIGHKQTQEIRDYGDIVRKAPDFDKDNTAWDLFIVSGEVKAEVDEYRHQPNLKFGQLYGLKNMNLWCFSWAELIARARVEMDFALKNIKTISEELRASDYLKKHHPDVFADMVKPRVVPDPVTEKSAVDAQTVPAVVAAPTAKKETEGEN